MNIILFTISSFILLLFCFYDSLFFTDIYLFIAIAIILSILNHGSSYPIFKWADRIYLVVFILYILFIYKTTQLIKSFIFITSCLVLYSIFNKNTFLHAISLFICIFIIFSLIHQAKTSRTIIKERKGHTKGKIEFNPW